MLESVVSKKVKNIGPSFDNNCDVKYNIRTWFDTDNLKSICSNSNRLYRKRYYHSTFDKEHQLNQNFEGIGKRRKEFINKQNDFSWNKNINFRKSRTNFYRKPREVDRMTRTSCCQLRRPDSRYNYNRRDQSESGYQRNRFLSSSNEGICLPHNQLPVIEVLSDHQRNSNSDRRHPNLLHQISSHNSQSTIHGKEALTASNISNNINNYCTIQTSQISQSSQSCGLINQLPMSGNNSSPFGWPHQINGFPQRTRRRHNTTDVAYSYQGGVLRPTQYLQSRPTDIISSQPSISSCTIPNRTLSTNTSPFPFTTRSFCQNPNQLRFTTYPIGPYPPQQQAMFSRALLPAAAILPHNTAFCSTIPMPTVIGDVISSTPCHQCAIMAGSGLSAFSNVSSMLQFSVAPTAASLITLTAVPRDRIHGSRLSYLPVHTVHNWHHHHPYLPPTWSYNDLSSILHNSANGHLLQDHLAQRFFSTSPNIGIQFVMMTPSSVIGSNDPSQIRHHLIPIARTDSLSRFLPPYDHIPLTDQPKPGITKQELDQIPVKRFVKSDLDSMATDDEKERCMICLEDFMPNEIIRLLRCAHDFHSSCVEKWLKINRTCPLCRADAAGQCRRNS